MKTILITLISTFTILSCNTSKEEIKTSKTANYIESEEIAKMNWPFSEAVQYGDILYVSGQVGNIGISDVLIDGGIAEQTHQTMLNIKKILEENGSSLDNVIKCTCMLADIKDWAEMSKAYMQFFPKHKPARSAFGTSGLAIGALVEIECMAYIK